MLLRRREWVLLTPGSENLGFTIDSGERAVYAESGGTHDYIFTYGDLWSDTLHLQNVANPWCRDNSIALVESAIATRQMDVRCNDVPFRQFISERHGALPFELSTYAVGKLTEGNQFSRQSDTSLS
jgi:hypothetical protein